MALTVVWWAQAQNQFVATLAYFAKDAPLTAELVHRRVEKSLKPLCDSPEVGVPAVIRNFEVICEAANKFKKFHPECVNPHPEAPLNFALEMRNTLLHVHFEIDYQLFFIHLDL